MTRRIFGALAPLGALFAAGLALTIVLPLDDWLGVLAYPLGYAAFAIGLAGLASLPAFLHGRRTGALAAVLALFVLGSPYLLSAPSARLLRSAMIEVPMGASEGDVRAVLVDTYAGSEYDLPLIDAGPERIHVSLLNQRAGDCTALLFRTEGGRVVGKSFSAD